MARCPACNNLNDEKVKFCEVCGVSLYSDARDRKALSEGKAKRKTKKFLREEAPSLMEETEGKRFGGSPGKCHLQE
jgi:hypothetical protein